MKALVKNGKRKVYNRLPKTWDISSGQIINFKSSSEEALEQLGFYNIVEPDFDTETQVKGDIYFDSENKVVTYSVSSIDFNKEVDAKDDDDNPTGEKEKFYKLEDIKSAKIVEIKSKANQLLSPTDWKIIRKIERDIDVDSVTATYRSEIIEEADKLENEVNSLSDYVDVLKYDVQFFKAE
jgi:hypothetical protein